MATCTHLDHVQVLELPEAVDGCAECLATGGKWLHLRICLECGQVGCCDDSPDHHASAHAEATGPSDHALDRAGGGLVVVLPGRAGDADPGGPGRPADPALAAGVSATAAVDVVLRDGSTARIRPAGPDDAPAVRDFLAGLGDEARWFRFFSAGVNLDRAAQDFAAPADGLALLVLTGTPERVVGHAMYVRAEPGEAEVAFAIDATWEGQGLATTLLAHLADAGAAEGIGVFAAVTMPGNHRMIGVFRASGFPVEVRTRPGELHLRFPTSPTEEGRRRFAARERDAAVAAVGHVLRPASVLVAAASAAPGTVGAAVLGNLAGGGYTGAVHAVLPEGAAPGGDVAVVSAVAAVPGAVELAVLALPGEEVLAAARACAARGDMRALVVVLEGPEEEAEQAELLAICRASGMRLVGPHCLGVVNTDPAVALNATFAPDPPAAGRVAFASQSGAFGIAALDLAAQRGIGLSSFVSMGDKADLSGNDFLQYWERDAGTGAVLLYLESFGNPRRFGPVARRVTAAKPVIAVKSARAPAAPAAGASQTGALLAASDVQADALFHHAGVIRTDTLAEMFDLAALLTRQPAPRGDRVAIITNADGPGVQCADACAAAGLRVPELGAPAQHALGDAGADPRRGLPRGARVANPVDLTAVASGGDYARALAAVQADPGIDAAIVLFARALATRAADVADALAATAGPIPVLAVFMGADQPAPLAPDGPAVPRFAAPEDAVRALARAVGHSRRLARPPDPVPALPGIEADRAAALIATALADGGGWLAPAQVEELLRCYGLRPARGRIATTARAAARAAARLGGPVAVKAVAPGLVAKSDIGAVALGLSGPTAVERAARDVLAAAREHGHDPDGVLVQEMARGTELLLGIAGDPRLGPLVVVGAGGATGQLIGDVQVRLAPIGAREAEAMVAGLRTFPLLDGFRGRPRADLAAVHDAVLRIGVLAAAHPEIAELDCDPVVAGPAGAVVVDARVRLEPPPEARPYAALGR